MPAYGFKREHEEKIVQKLKLHTIRADWKNGKVPRVGDRFIAFVGMRTKQCRRLFESTITKVQRVRMIGFEIGGVISVDENPLNHRKLCKLAHDDGFESPEAFWAFFRKEHHIRQRPFNGWLIHWSPEYQQ